MRLDTVILFTPQMEALANFYASGLGHAGDMHKSPGHVGFRLANGVYLGFDQVDVKGAGGLKETGVSLWFDVDSLDAAFERFVAAGATVRYAKKKLPMGDTLASLHDLDGNIFGLVER
ncbi:MAG: VOC family protein [Caldilineaceae bacterium]